MAFFFTNHQLGVNTGLRNNLPHPNRLLDSNTTVCLSVRNGKWDRNLGSVVQRRYFLEELPNFGISFVSVFQSASSTAVWRGILKERGPVGNAKVGNATC